MAVRDSRDEELLAAAGRGDEAAFADFYRRHIGGVIGFFMNRVADPELSFDLTAEVFAAVVVGCGGYDPARGQANAWLYGIAQNKLLESLRHRRVQNEARARLDLEPLALSDADLEEVTELGRGGEPVLELLADLPLDQRRAVRAHVVEERSYAEIARRGATTRRGRSSTARRRRRSARSR